MKVLVIVVNRLRPDFLGCYGCDWHVTPAFDRLASEGVVFDQHFADSPRPRATRRSWRWGDYGWSPDAALHPGLAGLLWNTGVKTWLIADERSPSFGHGFASGWQRAHWVREHDLKALEQEHLLGGTIQLAVDWLGQHSREDNWLLWLELSSVPLPWNEAEAKAESDVEGGDAEEGEPPLWFNPPDGPLDEASDPEALERLQNSYAAMVRGVDDWLGQLFDLLREKGLYDDLCILLTGDCGLPLGDHGQVGDSQPLMHEELLHVPLLLRLPRAEHAGRRVAAFTQSVDLLPTLAELFELPARETDGSVPRVLQPGQSLLPLARGESAKPREFVCSGLHPRHAAQWSIRTREWHFILAPPPLESGTLSKSDGNQLYVKPEDRWEVNNVRTQHAEIADQLELKLRRFLAGDG
jgi:arylsulfatase A-like enzyme